MIWPFCVMIIRSVLSLTERTSTTLPIFGVIFILITPLRPRAGQPVILERSPLAIAVFGNREDQTVFLDCCNSDQIIAFVESSMARTPRAWPAHRTNILFVEANRHAVVRSEEDEVLAVGDLGAEQFIAVVQRDGDDAARTRIIEFGQFAFLDDALLRHHHNELPSTKSFTARNVFTVSSG